MKTKQKREKGQKYQSVKAKIVIILQQQNNVTRQKLAVMLNKPLGTVDQALLSLRKAGYKIWPSKGPGTPLRIAVNETDGVRFINWRRRLFLDTAKRMVIAEFELGEQHKELSGSAKELLLTLTNAPHARLSNSARK